YLRADAQHFGVEAIANALARLKRTDSETRLVKQYDEVYAYLLWPALLLLLIEACLGESRRVRRNPSMAALPAALVMTAFLPLLGAWNPLERNNRPTEAGNASMKNGKPEEALTQYNKAVTDLPTDPGAHFNRGNALFALSRYEEASQEFLRATQEGSPGLRSAAFYNLGNTHFKNDKFDDAVAAYRHALALDPSNANAKWNLELALQKRKEEEEKKKDQKDKQDQSKNDKNDKPDEQDKDKKDQQKQDKDKDQNKDNKKDQQKQDKDQQENQPKPDKDKDENQPKQEPKQQEQKAQQDQQKQQAEGQKPPPGKDEAADMREIDAVLDNLEQSPKDLEKMRARLRAVRRAPPAKDW
ncbi:MAG: tetratricopeptide repeat protein, partial [Polyangia bacterium]